MNISAASAVRTLLNNHARALITAGAGYAGRGIGTQYGPAIVNWGINRTVTGCIPQFLIKNAVHAAIGSHYAMGGQLLFGTLAAISPAPSEIARTWQGYRFNRDNQDQLKTFAPDALITKTVEDDYVWCDDLQKKPPVIEDYVDMESFEMIGDDEAKNLQKSGVMGSLSPMEMDDMASPDSAEGFEFINKRNMF